ncbi:hypothetical protein [Metabacillus sp. FJAT-52054]|uniref:Uncharacterized protein n=1 Tax=Metabacillus sediminis TaxID=3117746 RepID=A0ABZ2NI67_9BACI
MKTFLRKGITAAISAFLAALVLQIINNVTSQHAGNWMAVYFVYGLALYAAGGIPVSYLLDFAAGNRGLWGGVLKVILYSIAGAVMLVAFFKFSVITWQLAAFGVFAALLFLAVETILKKRSSISS